VEYRIADLRLSSSLVLPSFEAFRSGETGKADVTLKRTRSLPAPGQEIPSGRVTHRLQADGWFCHPSDSDRVGLFISGDYTTLRLLGRGRRSKRRVV